MLQLLVKTNMPQFQKYVWYGVGAGMVVALIIGVGVVAAYYAAQNAFMSTSDKAIFSGVFSLLAAIFLTILGLEFLRFNDIQDKYRRKMAEGIQKAKEEVRTFPRPVTVTVTVTGMYFTGRLYRPAPERLEHWSINL